jgi:hypothetical protein
MVESRHGGFGDGCRAEHAGRQLLENGGFQSGDGLQSRVPRRTRGEIDARVPDFAERVRGGVDHAGKHLDPLELSQIARRQHGLEGGAQRLRVDRVEKSAGEADCRLLERHHLQAMTSRTGGREARAAHVRRNAYEPDVGARVLEVVAADR